MTLASFSVARLLQSTFAAPAQLLLDAYPNAAAAFSVRKLREAYAGACLRVRRASDNAEQDIGFSSNVLDVAAIVSFCGSSIGYVTAWYDQSGNGHNIAQTNVLYQPWVYDGSNIYTINSAPTVWANVSQLNNATMALVSQPVSFFAVQQPTSLIYSIKMFDSRSSSYPFYFITPPSGTVVRRIFAGTLLSDGNMTTNPELLFLLFNGASSNIGYNGGDSTGNVGTNQFQGLKLFAGGNNGNKWTGKMSEFVIYFADKTSDRTGIEGNINTYYGVY